jgi:hypothetical protein
LNSNSSARPPRRRLVEIAVFGGFLLGAIVFTYPLVLNLDDAVKDIGDPLLDTWAIAWVAHQLPRDPLHLFDANRYYPETGTLAFTDPMLAISIPVAPVQWLFDNPVLTLNVAMLLTLALSGYGMYRLVSALTESAMAGAVAGSIFTFNAYRLSHLAHVNLQAMAFIPLFFLCLGLYLEEGKRRHLIGVGVFLWLVSASCAYYGVFTWTVLTVALPYEIWRTGAWKHRRQVVALGLTIAVSAAAYLPLALPLIRLRQDFGFERPIVRVQRASARPMDYLRSGAHVHRAIGLEPPERGRSLFPGVLALVLGFVALARPSRRAGLYALIGVFAAWASLGPAYSLYGWLHAYFPGINGLRAPPRYVIFVMLALAVLAGMATSWILDQFRGAARVTLGSTLVLFPLIESFAGPIPYTTAPNLPPVYEWLAAQPDPAPVVEMPLDWELYKNSIYLYWSTSHFKPIANGHSTLVPPVFTAIRNSMEHFPDDESVRRLRSLEFRYVILHREFYLRARAERIERTMNAHPGLDVVHRTENETVFEIVATGERR